MRKVEREVLAAEIANALDRFQAEVNHHLGDEDFDLTRHWNIKRNSHHIRAVHAVLRRMAGTRVRCMYCVDSEGSDIEHFWPKSSYSNKTYIWENLLLACPQCGRLKGVQFPLNRNGSPLLIEPSSEDPWEFLDFDPDTGNLNARYLFAEGRYSERGEAVVRVLHLDRREGIATGYRKTHGRLCQLVMHWAEHDLAADYLDRLRNADDHGLLGWFLRGSGQMESSFSRFRERYQEAWATCQQSLG
jgi:uncharacterized protein (TIGR02646 family)